MPYLPANTEVRKQTENNVLRLHLANKEGRVEKSDWLVVAEYGSDGEIIEPKIAVVDGENIKQDTWYTVKNGKFAEV